MGVAVLAAGLLFAGCSGRTSGTGSPATEAAGSSSSARPGGSGPPGLPPGLPTGLPGLPTESAGASGTGDRAVCAQVLKEVSSLTTDTSGKPAATVGRLYADTGRRVSTLAGSAQDAGV